MLPTLNFGDISINLLTIIILIAGFIIIRKLKHSIISPIVKLILILFILDRLTPLILQLGFVNNPGTIVLIMYHIATLAIVVYGFKIIKKINFKLLKIILIIILIAITLNRLTPLLYQIGYNLDPTQTCTESKFPCFLVDLADFIKHPFMEPQSQNQANSISIGTY